MANDDVKDTNTVDPVTTDDSEADVQDNQEQEQENITDEVSESEDNSQEDTETLENSNDNEQKQSDRAQSRQHELAKKLEEAERKLSAYEQQGRTGSPEHSELTDVVGELNRKLEENGTPDYSGDWVSDLELARERAVAEAKAEVRKELQFEQDIAQAEQKYPQLNSDSEKADKDLIGLINETWQLSGGLKSGRRFSDFVDRFMSVQNKSKSLGAEESLEKLKQQESEQAITPSGTGTKESKDPKEMSLDELRSQLGYASYD